jgi:hypothetical protein
VSLAVGVAGTIAVEQADDEPALASGLAEVVESAR